ncbi:hypothetical protein BCR43DRAFT_498688 [Syncephalastrum racemosum]|uniref:Hyaluronan/mRNA-binding protein domain-containing protein n=1 Tax=Syncephalastrum racemosum TaxID=13706 RepID=A0A1X2H1A1_SYNRA|nr:hypothetical protein BCR43DRAFT_498688 [Syncephalastrum racemosum]
MSTRTEAQQPMLGTPTKQDKLGNDRPIDIPQDSKDDRPPTHHEQRKAERKAMHGIAVSPPDRRRGADTGEQLPDPSEQYVHVDAEPTLQAAQERRDREQRGRQFDRHPGNLGDGGSQKKFVQGWGHPGEAETEALTDVMSPRDPAAEDKPMNSKADNDTDDSRFKTLDEYHNKAEEGLPQKYHTPKPREPNSVKVNDPAKGRDGSKLV